MNGPVIEADNLTKTFRDGVVAVKDFDLQIKRGAVYGLLGRNGSGKTTALRLLMGFLQPDRGEARVLGWDLWRAPRSVRARVAYVAQTQQLPGWRTVEELCRCQQRWNERLDRSHARALADGWKLPWRRRVGGLSAGEQRKVAIAVALAS